MATLDPVVILCGGRGTRLRERTESIPKALVEIGGRPIIWHPKQVTCQYPYVKGITVGVNSPYNLWRMEDAWLDK